VSRRAKRPKRAKRTKRASDRVSRRSRRVPLVLGGRQPLVVAPIIIDERQSARALNLGLNTFRRRVADGKLPQPVRISDRRKGWVCDELIEAAKNLPREPCERPNIARAQSAQASRT